MARGNSGDWVPCQNYGSLVRFSDVGGMGGILLVRHGLTSDTGVPPMNHPQTAVMETTEALITHRVVGQFDLRVVAANNDDDWYLHMRIVKCVYDEDDDEFLAFEDSLSTGDDANSQFLWERHFSYNEGLNTGSSLLNPLLYDPAWSSIDVTVKRRLEREECLMLLLELEQGQELLQMDCVPFLRTWVTRG